MNPARLKSMEAGLTGVARKVLDATPISEGWPASRIQSEIKRLTQSQVDNKTVLGCLAHLVEQGLVKELQHGCFQRERFKEREPHVKLVKDEPMSTPKQQVITTQSEGEKDLFTRGAAMAQRMRDGADELEEFILDTQKLIADQGKKTKLLDQFRELFKE